MLVATESGVTETPDKSQNTSDTLDDLLAKVSEVLKEPAELIADNIVNLKQGDSNKNDEDHQQVL